MKLKSIFLGVAMMGSAMGITMNARAQTSSVQKHKKKTGSFYISWGYNHEWYTKSDVHVKQDAVGNDYTLTQVSGHDKKGWDKSIFVQQATIPQYNYRIGYYFNEKQDMGFEINFDHTKFIITDNQNVHLKGKLNGAQKDTTIYFSEAQGFYYFLNNGANFFLLNFVKRWGIYHTPDNKFRLDFNGKVGVGPVVPHVQNEFFGVANDPHFQVGGWNTGIETAVRATVLRYGFVEFSQKADYARYSGLRIADGGTVHQAFGTYELILTVGATLPRGKHNPLFEGRKLVKVEKEDEKEPEHDDEDDSSAGKAKDDSKKKDDGK